MAEARNHTIFGLARMNLAIHDIFADIYWNPEGTLLKDAFPDERLDYILANPPFNIEDCSGDLLQEDTRWAFGAPPVKNANFPGYSIFTPFFRPRGLMANEPMSSMAGGEGDIRRAMVQGGDAVDCMVALPG